MEQREYDKLVEEYGATGLVRPFGINTEWHKTEWRKANLTILICQKKTKDLIQLTLESILRFYPDIPMLIVDGDSKDDSTLYLRYMTAKYPHIQVWEREGLRSSHGETLHQALRDFIKTRYVLIMDSDVIVERGGWVEMMLQKFEEDEKLYACGSLMLVTRSGEACGSPKDNTDILRYAHISTAIYHVPTYFTLEPFIDHGACACWNMIDAADKGLHVGAFPIERYVSHLSGGSWCIPHTIWKNDFDVFVRPFITFIVTLPEQVTELGKQTDHDFNIVLKGNFTELDVVVHGSEPQKVTNWFYDIRFKVNGEYIVVLNEAVNAISNTFVHDVKVAIIEAKAPKTLNVGGLMVVERKQWQRVDALI